MKKRKDLLGLKDLSATEINDILDSAAKMKKIFLSDSNKVPLLSGHLIAELFYENSTRTRMSFEAAAKSLGARFTFISTTISSVAKGEMLIDTGKNIEALGYGIIILRHSMAGAPHLLAKNLRAGIINAGDGMNEHPTQALLDIFTMREKFGTLKGLKVVLAGDIKYSRVARSNIWGLNKFGADVVVIAPKTLLPADIETLGCRVANSIDEAVVDANVIMGLRIQTERQQSGMFPSVGEYAALYGINEERVQKAAGNVLLMHPGPVNRGVEMSSASVDCKSSVILEQVTNGVAVRMAVLDMLK